MTSDLALLQDYARNRVQASFTALVQRHLDLVYSAALRQVRSPELAEEVAQSVFTDLARSTDKLRPNTILTAWLYQVARRTAIDVVRRESRRKLREQVALEMNAMNAVADDWTHIEPLLDDAMEALDEMDRTAVLLRYFENKPLRAIGEQLGVSEDAAQKRVSRAMERLREYFAKHKVTIAATGLVAVVSANAVNAAPVGLAATISAATAVTGAAVATSAAAVAGKAVGITTLQKTIITTLLAVVAGGGIYEAHNAGRLREQVRTLQQRQAPLTGQIAALSNAQADAEQHLAALRAENERLSQNASELLKLRGQVTRLRNKVTQLRRGAEENAQQMSTTNTGQDVLDAFFRRNDAEMAKRAAQEASNKVASLKSVLELTPWQEASIRDALNRVVRRNELENGTLTLGGYTGTEILEMNARPTLESYLTTNGMGAAQAAENGQEILQMDQDLKILLSPGQRLLYEQYKKDQAETRAHQISGDVALKLTKPLALTKEQQAKVASAVYDLWTAPPALPTGSHSSEWLRDQTLNALAGTLTPDQLKKALKLEDPAAE